MKFLSYLNDSRDRRLIFCCFLLTVTAIVFWQVRSSQFVLWDDKVLLYENPYYCQLNPPSLWFFWTHPYEQIYMPLTYSFWGVLAHYTRSIGPAGNVVLDPAVFHTLNLALHVANALLVFGLLKRIVRALFAHQPMRFDESQKEVTFDTAAVVGALLFAIHPLQVESVAWASETKGLLAAFFGLAAVLLFCRFLDATSPDEPRVMRRVVGLWLAALLCFTAALLSKPNSVILPALALLLAVVLWKRNIGRMCLILSPWFALAVALVLFTARVQLVAEGPRSVAFPLRFLVSSDAILFYLRKLLVPLDLAIKYGRKPEWLVVQPWAYLTLLCPLILGVMAWRLRKHCWPVLALGWTVVALVPNLGLIPFGFQQYSTVSDRYFYIPMVGPAMVLAVGFILLSQTRMPRITRSVAAAGLVAFGAIGLLSWRQVRVWTDTSTLLTHAVTVNPRDTWSYLNLGRTQFEAGNLDRAADFAKAAIGSAPRSADAYFGLASVRRFQKRPAEAIRLYWLALKYNPLHRAARLGLAAVLADGGDGTGALREYKIMVRDNPGDFKAAALGGQILLKQGNLAEADKYAAQAVASAENYAPGHLLMGQVQLRRGNDRAAMESFGRALQLDPSLVQARLPLSELLVKGKLQLQAVQLLQEGLQISPGDMQLQRALARVQSMRQAPSGLSIVNGGSLGSAAR